MIRRTGKHFVPFLLLGFEDIEKLEGTEDIVPVKYVADTPILSNEGTTRLIGILRNKKDSTVEVLDTVKKKMIQMLRQVRVHTKVKILIVMA